MVRDRFEATDVLSVVLGHLTLQQVTICTLATHQHLRRAVFTNRIFVLAKPIGKAMIPQCRVLNTGTRSRPGVLEEDSRWLVQVLMTAALRTTMLLVRGPYALRPGQA